MAESDSRLIETSFARPRFEIIPMRGVEQQLAYLPDDAVVEVPRPGGLTERVVVASKGRFQRARSLDDRAAAGLPYESTISSEDFMALTLDVWQTPSESARRGGHPESRKSGGLRAA